MVLTEYNYLFALGVIFAALDAWNIGANDVANSWATSVASRSLTLMQAMIGASIFEFAGAVGVGARVADTIRTKIVSPVHYEDQPSVLMLGMVCAIMGSSIWLTIATKIGLPVSTTHSLLGGVVGMGIASVGASKVTWVAPSSAIGTDKINTGVVSVFLAWIVAPGLSAFFASALFLSTKYGVMLRKDPVKKAFALIPVYFGLTAILLAMLLIWKGGSYKVELSEGGIAGAIIGTGFAWALLVAIFFMPWLWRVVVKEDWQLRWWHIAMGPLLLKRPEPTPPPADFESPIRDFYEGHLTREELDARRAVNNPDDIEAAGAADKEGANAHSDLKSSGNSESSSERVVYAPRPHKSIIGPKPEGLPWHSGAMLFWYFKFAVFHGVDQDVVSAQKKKDMFSGDLEDAHARATHFDNKAEFMYSFLQIMTAATASFTHGANDISNAIGPFTTIYEIWRTGAISKEADVPIWILAFGAAALVVGLWTYGYNIMRNLGNKLTLNSPSRGFSMELGSAITIIVATRLKLPVSTTQCITGAIVGVGLCNGDWRALNWRMIAWIYGGWIFTLPIAGLISGILMGIILNAPRW
ncbi:putative phosphate-repressible phosphate permease [Rosellinia necatrix]|uniref:Phosphate transporter n=1 Tax=Rosellinia necatrix TaxID=77044 RepID=A0A1W2TWK6_ROSNE|nr:putative phosphate-repressible phosphate permease [Rosellinia necatrix]